jgi:hypothetical protein
VIDGLQRKVACVGRSVNESAAAAAHSTHSPIVGFGNWTLSLSLFGSSRRGCTIRLDQLPFFLLGIPLPLIHSSLSIFTSDLGRFFFQCNYKTRKCIYSISFLNKEIRPVAPPCVRISPFDQNPLVGL